MLLGPLHVCDSHLFLDNQHKVNVTCMYDPGGCQHRNENALEIVRYMGLNVDFHSDTVIRTVANDSSCIVDHRESTRSQASPNSSLRVVGQHRLCTRYELG